MEIILDYLLKIINMWLITNCITICTIFSSFHICVATALYSVVAPSEFSPWPMYKLYNNIRVIIM